MTNNSNSILSNQPINETCLRRNVDSIDSLICQVTLLQELITNSNGNELYLSEPATIAFSSQLGNIKGEMDKVAQSLMQIVEDRANSKAK